MESIDIKTNAINEYNIGDNKIRKSLKNIFGEDFFKSQDFKQILQDFMPEFLEACKKTGDDPTLPFPEDKTEKQEIANAWYMIDVFHDLALGKTVLDWTNSNQKKWWGWFNDYQSGSGFRFGDSGGGWAATFAGGGARFCLATKEESDKFCQKYLPLINIILKPKNQ